MHGQIRIPFLHHRISLPEEVVHLYLVSAIRTFLSASAAIFLPLYIYQTTGSVFLAFLFLFLDFLWLIIATSLVVFSMRRVTFEWLGLVSTVAFSGLFFFVYTHRTIDTVFMFVAPMLYGISGGLYWLFHHLVYSAYGERHVSRNFSYESIINTAVGVVAPMVSGFIAYFLSYHVFFALASILSIGYLFLWVKHLKHRTVLDLQPLRQFYRNLRPDRIILYILGGVYTIPLISIPIYLAVNTSANTPAAIGIVMSVSALLGAVVTYILGKYVDESHDYPLGAIGFSLLALLLLHMLYTPGVAHYLAALRGIFGTLAFLPVTSWIYRLGSTTHGAELYLRELALFVGRVVYLAFLFYARLTVEMTLLLGVYSLVAYGMLFYYLSRIRYPEVNE